jgi:DNA polymerase III alpha subunit
MSYAELHVTTQFSFLRGASSPLELFQQAKFLGLPALGITDRNWLAGIVRAHEAARETGVAAEIAEEQDHSERGLVSSLCGSQGRVWQIRRRNASPRRTCLA